MLFAIAFLCFLASAIWAFILREWPVVLLGAGLCVWVLDQAGSIRIG